MTSQSLTIFVLGMHRSGTSCLAGSLEHRGVYFGNVQKSNKYNPKGNRERIEINQLNEMLLTESGGSWQRPPRLLRWTSAHARTRDRIIRKYHDCADGPWGCKDPRFTFTLPFWREAIPDLRIVASFRHPIMVARSLAKRNQYQFTESLAIWSTYNEKLLEHFSESPFALISFDAPDDEYRSVLMKTFAMLELSDHGLYREFFDPYLRHYHGIEEDLQNLQIPKKIATTYLALRDRYRDIFWAKPS